MADWDAPLVDAAPPPRRAAAAVPSPPSPDSGGATFATEPRFGSVLTADTPQPDRASADLPTEADALYGRVRAAEGTAKGSGYVIYGGKPFTPGKEHPGETARVPGPSGPTSAAGPGQWEEATWNGLKPEFRARFGHEAEFDSDADQKRMTWINAAKAYPGGEAALRRDVAAGKLNTAALAAQWEGFKRGSGGGWDAPLKTTSAGKWNVSPNAIAFEQNRRDTDVVWMSPDDYLGMVPESSDRDKRRSLLKSLSLGDDVEAIPTLETKMEGGRPKIIDQDGRNRAMVAKQEGVDLIPVAVRGAGAQPSWIEDMHGNVHRFNFAPVGKVQAPRQLLTGAAMQGPASPTMDRILSAAASGAREGFGDRPIGLPEDVAQALRGVSGIVPVEAAARAVAAPLDVMGRAVNAGLYGLARGGGQALGEVTGAASQPGFDPGIGAIRNVIAPGQAFLGGAGAMPEARIPEGAGLVPRAGLPAPPGPINPAVTAFLANVRRTGAVQNAARDIINRRAGQDIAAGGAVPSEIARQMAAGRGEGMVLADVAGENVRGLLGNVAREAGPGREIVKQWAVNRLGDIDRDSPLATNIEQGIEANLATGSARTEARALAEQRAASKPLWDEAMAGGSIAPLRTQLERQHTEAGRTVAEAQRDINAIENEATQAAARQSQAGNVYSSSAANRARRYADDRIAEKQKALDEAQAQKAEIEGLMRRAQADDTANAPGAVWSPYIGRLLKNPVVAEGIKRGMRIERNVADGENRPFNVKEYAIVGQDEAGDPIVGAVPNMRLLAVAKEGMDAMLESDAYKDPLTGRLNKAGRAVKILRDGMLNELDRLNPAYKPARDKWAGDSALITAVRDGKLFHKQSPEEIREWFGNASESEKSFYRLGAADTMRDDLQRRVFDGDPSKAIINSPRSRNQLLPMFRSAEDATRFLDQVKRARTMFRTPVEVLGNSKTAAREAEDAARRQGLDTAEHVLHGVASAAMGHPVNAMARMARGAASMFGPRTDPAVNAAIARILTDPRLDLHPQTGGELLRRLPLPHTQNALQRGLLNYGRRFAAPGGLR